MLLLGFRYVIREPMRLGLTAAGVALAVLLTVFLAGVYRGAVSGSLRYIEQADADVWVGRTGTWNLMRSGGLLPLKTRERIARVPGVRGVEPMLAALAPATVDGGRRTLLVIGLWPGAASSRPKLVVEGAAVPKPGEVVIDRAFATRARLRLGDSLTLAEHRLRISGITRQTNLLVTQYAFVSREDLARLLGLGRSATFFLVRARDEDAAALARRIEVRVPGVAAFDREAFLANNRREIASGFLPVLWAIALLGLAVGGTVVALMTYVAVLEKRADYALLGALGGGEGLRSLVVLEQALAAALLGGAGGLVLLAALAWSMPHLVPELELRLEPVVLGAALLGTLLMAALGALIPARLATRISPLEALRR
jgi:putative ABC transport system permease protein